MSTSKSRRHFTPAQKAAIVRRHLSGKEPVSNLADEFGLQPTQIHLWVKTVLDQAEKVFERTAGGRVSKRVTDAKDEKIARLETKLIQKNEVIVELMQEHVQLKKGIGGTLKGVWVPHDTRDEIMDYVNRWSERTELPLGKFVSWLAVAKSKFYNWRERYGKVNEHNGQIPRDFWLEDWEKSAIVAFHDQNPLEGYRRLTFMMLDQEVVAVSPSSVYRVLKQAGRLDKNFQKPSKKGTGFEQPLRPHQHWHVDMAYVNVAGTFYFLCTILDGYSRFIVHWELRPQMTEIDVETILQRGREKCPNERPRVISDNGPQFMARDFKEFIRQAGMTHVRTSPYYPQSNGKLERYHRTVKGTGLVGYFADAEEVRAALTKFVTHYNEVRLHSAIGYVTPADKLAGREVAIHAARDAKLEAARERRRQARAAA